MAPTNKRSHKTLTLLEKVKFLDALKKGKSGKQLALEYGVGASTISDIKRKSENLKRFTEKTDHMVLKKRKTLRSGEYADMENRLYSWFMKQRDRNVPISRELLCEKAKQFFRSQYGSDKMFNASTGWYEKFKKRFAIRGLKICGETLSSQPDLVNPFRLNLEREIERRDLSENQIYNADESALFWKMLPDKTLVHSKEKVAPGRKMCKERVTFLCCANRSGLHKLKIIVVGKSKNPRSFKNNQPQVEYYSSRNAWMTSSIFTDWFLNSFVPQVKAYQTENNLPFKAILLVDNARCHCREELATEDDSYKIIFLPPNCTSLIQPMDQNAIRITKMFYKKSLLSHLLNGPDEELSIALKSLTLKDACVMLSQAWQNVTHDIIRKCWHNLFTHRWSSEDDLPLATLFQKERSERQEEENNLVFMQNILNEATNCNLQNEDIQAWIQEEEYENTPSVASLSSTENEDNFRKYTPVKHQDATKHFNACIRWAEDNDVDIEKIIVLRELRDVAFERALKKTIRPTFYNFLVVEVEFLQKKYVHKFLLWFIIFSFFVH